MENSFSKKIIQENLKKKVLVYFTLELIKNSKSKEIANLKKVIEKKEDTKESEKDFEHIFGSMLTKIELLKKVQLNNSPKIVSLSSLNNNNNNNNNNRIKKFPIKRNYPLKKRFLDIPDIALPSHLSYLKPIPERKNLDFFKINPLINDQRVREIIANPNDNVIVKGAMGIMPSIVYLTKEDIITIINLFSKYSKIPLNEGVYKVVLGDLILSAYLDKKNQDFRFKIRKMI